MLDLALSRLKPCAVGRCNSKSQSVLFLRKNTGLQVVIWMSLSEVSVSIRSLPADQLELGEMRPEMKTEGSIFFIAHGGENMYLNQEAAAPACKAPRAP
jgi:hypothetical protein